MNGLVSATFGFGLDETLLCRCVVKLDRCPPNCRLAINVLRESGKCDWAGMAGDWEVVAAFGLSTCGGGGSSAACRVVSFCGTTINDGVLLVLLAIEDDVCCTFSLRNMRRVSASTCGEIASANSFIRLRRRLTTASRGSAIMKMSHVILTRSTGDMYRVR
jgi:hypothetical protein